MTNYNPNNYLDTLTNEDKQYIIESILIKAIYNSSEPVPQTEPEWTDYVDKTLQAYHIEQQKQTEKKLKKQAKEAAKSPEQKEYERCRRNYLARHREAENLRVELQEIANKEAYWENKMREALDKLHKT